MSGPGIALSRRFFQASLPFLNERLPDIMSRSAAGLAGEGSECLGVDDDISRDHDWGASFCLWIPDELLAAERDRIEKTLAELPAFFEGHPVRMKPEARGGRVGPLPLRGFYRRFLGMDGLPVTWQEWRKIPEYHLCSCTNGEVFMDAGGEFTAMRNKLLAGYPEDVRRKKIAARCMIMAQAGQYNLPRSLQRGDTVAAMLAAARFAEAALSMVFLLERRFMPFYKWAARLAQNLSPLGQDTANTLKVLSRTSWDAPEQGMPALEMIEKLCARTAEELRRQGLTSETGNWLWAIGPAIQKGVTDPELRRLNVMED
ncbi:MAG: DUF4037 domain-containing protein [Mailhella sp.]|nr:DUF4037 domain-containing protein [Mailhella sp.]